ncbi:MAG: sigma 54-interacting transcriptional regulator [Deltaproteobacteria bacterium]|nr:sigma 54-interacting transcriptional regulator [Deltaproteobacteria bacterium]
MITGAPNIDTAAEAVRLGAFDYLPKPVKKEILIKAAHLALRHKALDDEKEKYRRNLEAIFSSLKDSIITVDQNMVVIEANRAVKNICGVSYKEIIGKNFNTIQADCCKACVNVLTETLKTEKPIKEYRVECCHPNYPRQVVLLTSSPLLDQDSRFKGAILVVRDITRISNLERELQKRHEFYQIVGKSSKMKKIFGIMVNLFDTDTTVLIYGESGTGKELVAKALHYGSTRSEKPLVTVSCSALSESLLESELFGHVKGAFTGASHDKTGRFQKAAGGTIFLDEIGDISANIQLKLLRVIQEKEFEPVGSSDTVKVDVRVVAATNRNLKEKVKQGDFREDLFYRLKVMEINLPPLREREEDILLLIEHFRQMFNARFNKKNEGFSKDVLDILMKYEWPGNVRELEHAIERAFILCRDGTVTTDGLPPEIIKSVKGSLPDFNDKSAIEPDKILITLNGAGWNKAKAARQLGISRLTLYRKIEKYNIIRPSD